MKGNFSPTSTLILSSFPDTHAELERNTEKKFNSFQNFIAEEYSQITLSILF